MSSSLRDAIMQDTPWPYSSLREMDEALKCPICYDYFDTAMMLDKCSHTYCSLCIRRSLGFKTQCPTCRKESFPTELKKNKLIDHLVKVFRNVRDEVRGVKTKAVPVLDTSDASAKPVTNRIALPIYRLMKDNQVRDLLRSIGLPAYGSKQDMIDLHREFVVQHNAQCDAENPVPDSVIIQNMLQTMANMHRKDSATALLGAAAITAAQSLHIQPPRPVRSASAPTTAASVSAPTSAPAPMDSQSQSSTTRDGRIDSMFAVGPVSQSGSSETFVGIADGASQQPVPSANVTVRLAESNSQAAAPTSKSSFEALTQQLIEQRKQRKAAQAAAAAAAAATTGSSASTDSVSATDSSAAASSYSVAAAFELAAIPLATITEVPMELLEATAATTDSMAHGSAGLGSDAASSSESATTPAKRGRPSRQSKQLQSTLAAFGKPAGTSGAERAKRRRTGGDTSHMDTIIDISSSEEAGAAAALTESRVFQFKRAVPSVSAAEPMDFAASAVIGSSFAAPILVDNSGTVDLTSTLASTLSATSSSLSSYDATASSAPSTPSNRTMDVAATPPATALSPASSSQPSASSGKSSPPRAVGMTTRARNMASL